MDWLSDEQVIIGTEDCLYLNVYTPEVGEPLIDFRIVNSVLLTLKTFRPYSIGTV